jgi:chromate transporter
VNIGQLFWRFALVSILAFGGGAGIPLIERTAVLDAHWINPHEFTAAIGLAQILPGPVLVVAAFIGFRRAGLAGGLAAVLGVFLFPWASAAAFARQSDSRARFLWLHRFRKAAAAAGVGLLGVTALGMAHQSLEGPGAALVAVLAFLLALLTRIHPFWILLGGAVLGILFHSP